MQRNPPILTTGFPFAVDEDTLHLCSDQNFSTCFLNHRYYVKSKFTGPSNWIESATFVMVKKKCIDEEAGFFGRDSYKTERSWDGEGHAQYEPQLYVWDYQDHKTGRQTKPASPCSVWGETSSLHGWLLQGRKLEIFGSIDQSRSGALPASTVSSSRQQWEEFFEMPAATRTKLKPTFLNCLHWYVLLVYSFLSPLSLLGHKVNQVKMPLKWFYILTTC